MGSVGEPAPIPLVELRRLFKLLGLLGSDFEGERASAALMAHRWVVEHATSWEALLTPPEAVNPVTGVGVAGDDEAAASGAPPAPAPFGLQVSWKAAAQAVLAHYPAVLRSNARGAYEEDFVRGLLQKGWSKLTDKQADWLRDICARAGLSW